MAVEEPRLGYPRKDVGKWGAITNKFLRVAHNEDGTLKRVIGTDVQAWDAQLDDIAALAVTNGNFIVGDGANWVAESGDTARTSLGLGTGDSPALTGLTLSGLTQGSVLFAGVGGVISQDNTKFFWDDSTNRLGLGTASPTQLLELSGGNILLGNNQAYGIRLADNSSVLAFSIDASNDMILGTVLINNMIMRVKDKVAAAVLQATTGYVGLGISPSAHLHIYENAASVVESIRLDNVSSGSDFGNAIKWYGAGQSHPSGLIEVVRNGAGDDFDLNLGTSDNITTTDATTKIKIKGNGNVLIGGVTNYAQFAADGELTLSGTARAWKSMELDPQNIGKPNSNPPGVGRYQEFTFDRYNRSTEESTYYMWHVPGDFAVGNGSIRGHFGFLIENPPSGADENVRLGFEYKKISPGDVLDFSSGTSEGYLDTTIVDGESAYKWHETSLGVVTTTGFAVGDILLFRFYRDATAVEDTYDNEASADDNDVWIGQYHLEYLRDKLGEAA